MKPEEVRSSKKRSKEHDNSIKNTGGASKRGRTANEENVADAPKRKRNREKRKHQSSKHQDSSTFIKQESDEDDKKPEAASSSSTAAATGRKYLKDYSVGEVAELLQRKGNEFHEFAARVRRFSFDGEIFAEQLEKGEESFLSFLEHRCGLNGDVMLRYSIMVSLKKVLQ